MKKIFFSLLLLGTVLAVSAQKLSITPTQPQSNQIIKIVYNPTGGKLENQSELEATAYTFINDKQETHHIKLHKEGDVYTGNYTPAENAALTLFVFKSGKVQDVNIKGYYTTYFKNNQPVPYAYYWESMLYSGLGKSYAGMDMDRQKASQILEKGINLHPELKRKFYSTYVNLIYSLDKDKGTQLAKSEIEVLSKIKSKSIDQYTNLLGLFSTLKMTNQADSISQLYINAYPSSDFAFRKAFQNLYMESDLVKKEKIYAKIVQDFGFNSTNFQDHDKADDIYFTMSEAYATADNQEKYRTTIDKIKNKQTKAQAMNSYAWNAAEKKENVAFATALSKESLSLIEQVRSTINPSDKNADQLLNGLNQNYAMFADTYALLLSYGGDFKEALKYQEMAVSNNNFSDADMNTRFVQFLNKAGYPEKAKDYAEKFIKEGKANAEIKELLKSVYNAPGDFESYYASLEDVAFEKEIEKYKAEMIITEAPGFTLLDLNGNTVSLANLKGKVVIIDYWATWCGPCIASFPGMQKAVDKYKDDAGVAFLFINTWQNEVNREEVVRKFMKENPYTFQVLLDTKNTTDPSKFDVIEKYGVEGIPTKFIIDQNGKIRFKKVGFNGSADATVRELDALIKLTREAGTTTK